MLGSIVSLSVNTLSISIDFISYRKKWTKVWPKKIDVALCLLWVVFLVSLLTIQNDKFVRLYTGVGINLTLVVVSLVSASIGKPWIADNAADTLSDDEYIRKLESPTRESELKRTGFLYICKVLTLFWSGLFSIIAIATLINVECNTNYSKNNELTHPNKAIFILIGIVVPMSVILLGIWASPRIAEFLKARLLRGRPERHAASSEEPRSRVPIENADSKIESISEPLLN